MPRLPAIYPVPVTARFVVVAFVAVKPTMLATEALKVLAIAVPKFASVENKFVEVALVVIAFDEEAAPNEIEPALKLPLTLRLPASDVSPETESEFAAIVPPETDVFAIDPPVIVGVLIAVLVS